MARIQWTATGKASLESVALFIVEQNKSVDRALQIVDRIEAKVSIDREVSGSRDVAYGSWRWHPFHSR